MKVRVVDIGYFSDDAYRYRVQKQQFYFYWTNINVTDNKQAALDCFDTFEGRTILKEKEE